MVKKDWYGTPTQVKFRQEKEIMEDNGKDWFAGIAYGTEIICGCCGGIIPLDECEEVIDLSWIDIAQEIQGDA